MYMDLIKIVIHGRGGQGAVTACEIIAEAAYLSKKFVDVHAFPSFGAERRGAPVQAYAKLSRNETIWDRSQIEHPNILIVFDETVLNQSVVESLENDGVFIINSGKDPEFFSKRYNMNKKVIVITANISNLSLEKNLTIDGNPVINTPILGLLSRAIPELSLDNLKSVVVRRMGEKIGTANYELIKKGYEMAKIIGQ